MLRKVSNIVIKHDDSNQYTLISWPQNRVEQRYPVPAIPLSVHWPDTGYMDMVYIDDDRYVDDPQLVWLWDARA